MSVDLSSASINMDPLLPVSRLDLLIEDPVRVARFGVVPLTQLLILQFFSR